MQDQITDRIVKALQPVAGVAAIVLGGSRGRGTATEASDYDFGLYYDANAPIDVATLRAAVAPLLDDPATSTITSGLAAELDQPSLRAQRSNPAARRQARLKKQVLCLPHAQLIFIGALTRALDCFAALAMT